MKHESSLHWHVTLSVLQKRPAESVWEIGLIIAVVHHPGLCYRPYKIRLEKSILKHLEPALWTTSCLLRFFPPGTHAVQTSN